MAAPGFAAQYTPPLVAREPRLPFLENPAAHRDVISRYQQCAYPTFTTQALDSSNAPLERETGWQMARDLSSCKLLSKRLGAM